MRQRLVRPSLALLAGAAVVAGCDRTAAAPLAPTALAPAERPALLLRDLVGRAWTTLGCLDQSGATARGVIGPEGGAIAAGAFRIDFPAGAVDSARAFVLTVRPGMRRRIDARPVDAPHYTFAVPVTVTLDLSGCGALPVGLHAFHVEDDDVLLEDMGGALDASRQRLTFRTPHFSGYTIAWRDGEQPPADSTTALDQ